MQIRAAERGARLRQRRFEAAKIADAGGGASLVEERLMQVDNFAERQIAHQARRL